MTREHEELQLLRDENEMLRNRLASRVSDEEQMAAYLEEKRAADQAHRDEATLDRKHYLWHRDKWMEEHRALAADLGWEATNAERR